MSIAVGEGAPDGVGELRDIVEANDSSRSEERNSSISFRKCVILFFLAGARGGDGAGWKKAME